MTTQESISSSFHDNDWAYDVFINFRGEDTRYGFTGNLYDALNKKGIRAFFDGEELRKGDELTPSLLKAIEESRMAICVFSRNYACSTFCLDELVHIHQCIKGKGRLVWPIFYEVEPSEVRCQRGNYEQALAHHETKKRADEKKIQGWKLALREIANICGTHHNPRHGRYEYQLIGETVREISCIINRLPLYLENLVGVDYRLQQINSLANNFKGEQPMLKKRRLEDDHVSSDSMSLDQEAEQKPSTASKNDPHVNFLQEIEYESKTQTIDIQSARSRANGELVCWTQKDEALTNDDDHQVTRQDYIFDSNGNNSSIWDPMECEYEGTSHYDDDDDDPRHQRDHPWTRFLRFNIFTFVASLCSSS